MGTKLAILGIFGFFVGLVLLVIGFIKKKKMKGGLVLGISVVVFIIGFIMVPTNGTESSKDSKDNEKVETTAKPKEETSEDKALIEQKAKEETEKEASQAQTQQEQAKNDEKNKESKPVTTSSVDKTIKDIVYGVLGKTNNMKKDTVNDIQYVESDKGVIIALNASENFTTNMTKRGMWLDSKKVLQPLSKVDGLETIIIHWHYPLVDTYGNEKDVLVMAFEVDKATLNKIKWDNFLTDNVPNVVNNYFEHAVFKD
ncbi:cell envelope integrity protein TolA [Lysinibacillus sp. CTST325]